MAENEQEINFELENMDNTEFSYATYHVARTNTTKG